ncbi:helix-turn-helix domain-containing protein [Streptomyces syringium]|uniref:AraC-like DNA-binding protein n=1 Tax=Streptomyces syringium TaxID=76729 RepID=A0ABS4XVR1_9ACTN|nr:AraC family transcriptional regulator [Streptomyces syringium]MBP2400592.1 AraC-like DNA-binding protein [Streptomyces syringium]
MSYAGYRLHGAPPRRKLFIPATTVSLLLSWGDPMRVVASGNDGLAGTRWEMALVGLHTTAVTTEVGGTAQGVQLELTPLGAYAMFGLPMRHLADMMVDPAAVLGRPWVDRLVGRLTQTSDWARRWKVLDEAVAGRLAMGPQPSPVVTEAWQRLSASGGTMTIGDLATLTGRCRRRLEALFREQIGLPPKRLARILRFQRVITIPHAPDRNWAELAALCGYHDQSHLSREFRALTGLTANQFRRLANTPGDTTAVPVYGRIVTVRPH